MGRVSPRSTAKASEVERRAKLPPNQYVAKRDYGSRGAEQYKQVIPFGTHRVTIYRRKDLESGSWFMRVHLKQEKRHYRKSLQTTDRQEARQRAERELLEILAKVKSGERILAISLRDLVRRFSLYQQSLVASGELAAKTLVLQNSRIKLGCEFLKSIYPAELNTKISTVEGARFGEYLKWRQVDVAKKRKGGAIRRDVVRDELLVIRKMFNSLGENVCAQKDPFPYGTLLVHFAVEQEGAEEASDHARQLQRLHQHNDGVGEREG